MTKKYAILLNDYQIKLIHKALEGAFGGIPKTFSDADANEIDTLAELFNNEHDLLIEYDAAEGRVVNDFVECYLDNIEG